MTGSLIVVGTPIGNLSDFSPRAIAALQEADFIGCEDTRRTRALLSHFDITGKQVLSVHANNEQVGAQRLVEKALGGATVAYVSDSGMPTISDPGATVTRTFVDAGVPVSVVPGPTAATTALAVSGFSGARFHFEGFLPLKKKQAALQRISTADAVTVLYESPHRLNRTLRSLVDVCEPARRICICRELTKKFEEIWHGSLQEAIDHFDNPRGEFVIVIAAV